MKSLGTSDAKKQEEVMDSPSKNQAETAVSAKDEPTGKRVTFQQVDSFEMDEYLLERTCKESGGKEKQTQSDDDFDYDVSNTFAFPYSTSKKKLQ